MKAAKTRHLPLLFLGGVRAGLATAGLSGRLALGQPRARTHSNLDEPHRSYHLTVDRITCRIIPQSTRGQSPKEKDLKKKFCLQHVAVMQMIALREAPPVNPTSQGAGQYMEVLRLLGPEPPGPPRKRARHDEPASETAYQLASALREAQPRGVVQPGSSAFRPLAFRPSEAGQLEFSCRWPSCNHRSSCIEADAEHLRSHVVRRRPDTFRARLAASVASTTTLAPSRPLPALPPAPAPAPAPAPTPAPTLLSRPSPSSLKTASNPWRTSRPRTGNRIPLDQRRGTGAAAGVQFECEWPGCNYIALRRCGPNAGF